MRTHAARMVELALVVTLTVGSGVAADLPQFQPCWRGQSATTLQAWGFNTTPTNINEFGGYYGPEVTAPDAGGTNSHGAPQALIVAQEAGIGWFDTDSSISATLAGIWDLGYGGGGVTLAIPDAVASPSLTREIWIQITEATATDVTMTNTVTVVGGTLVGSVVRTNIEVHPNFTWSVAHSRWTVPANTPTNTITISGGCPSCNPGGGGMNSFVESVVVDTRLMDFSTISPGGSLDIATQTECTGLTVEPASTYNWEMNNATGAAGVGFDRVSVPGTSNINVQATSGSKCTINLISLNGNAPGQAANFNNNSAGSWSIASAGGVVLNFDASKFALSYTTSQFQNNLGGGVFSLALSGDSKSINLIFTPNGGPTASEATYVRASGLTLKIRISDLLAGFTSDPDGNPRALHAVDATSSQGGTITTDDTYIYYQPANDNADFFNYTVRDVLSTYRAGETRTASARINVSVMNPGGIIQEIATSGGPVTIDCAGIPGFQYEVQRSTNVAFTSYTVMLTTNAPSNGLFSYTDNSPPTPSAFYRLMQP